jgi:hypothetical protein
LITTGGTLQVRAGPTTDHEKLKAAAGLLFTDGGNILFDAVTESHNRFLRSGEYCPILLVMTVSGPGSRSWRNNQPLARLGKTIQSSGGTVYGLVLTLPSSIQGAGLGGSVAADSVDICSTLAKETDGFCWEASTPSVLADAADRLATQIDDVYRRNPLNYEIEYSSVGKDGKPDIRASRPGVRIEILSAR